MSTLKGRNAHKRGTFGGVAACPHCSAPVRLWLQVRRTQCVLDVVVASHLLPPSVPLEVAVERDPEVLSTLTSVLGASEEVVTASATRPADFGVIPAGGVDAAAAFPTERGFDDDEAPDAKGGSQVDLFKPTDSGR